MKHIIALLFAALYLIGCTSSNELMKGDANQQREINVLGREHRAAISLNVNSVTANYKDYEGDRIAVARDSLQWIDPQTQRARSAVTANLRRIRFIDRGTGAVEGAAVGAIPGAVLFGMSVGQSGDFSRAMQVAGPLVALGGAAIGAGIGALIGHKTDYTQATVGEPKIAAPNAIYVEVGTLFLIGGSVSVNYERTILPNLSLRAGLGSGYGFSKYGGSQLTGQAMVNYFSAIDGGRFEIGAGVAVSQSKVRIFDYDNTVSPAIAIGYRYQPSEGGFMFRVGAAWTYGFGFPFEASIGYAF